jgi:predicted HAD superfamily Cof-like phosphohydrolase
MTQMTFLPKTPADMVSEYAEVSQQEGTEGLYQGLIHEEYIELQDEMYRELQGEPNPENELKEMADLIYVLYGYARVKGYNLDKAVERVHQNNMGRMYQPDGTILRRDDGKVMKNKDFPKVDLTDLINKEDNT